MPVLAIRAHSNNHQMFRWNMGAKSQIRAYPPGVPPEHDVPYLVHEFCFNITRIPDDVDFGFIHVKSFTAI
jgi:hypothetical protein